MQNIRQLKRQTIIDSGLSQFRYGLVRGVVSALRIADPITATEIRTK